MFLSHHTDCSVFRPSVCGFLSTVAFGGRLTTYHLTADTFPPPQHQHTRDTHAFARTILTTFLGINIPRSSHYRVKLKFFASDHSRRLSHQHTHHLAACARLVRRSRRTSTCAHPNQPAASRRTTDVASPTSRASSTTRAPDIAIADHSLDVTENQPMR
jgi:hypothetical protein